MQTMTSNTAKHQRLLTVSREVFDDCAVIALAILADIDYAVARQVLSDAGRRRREGATTGQMSDALSKCIGKQNVRLVSVNNDVSAMSFADNNAGRYLLFTDDHVVAAEDGIVHDNKRRRSVVRVAVQVGGDDVRR